MPKLTSIRARLALFSLLGIIITICGASSSVWLLDWVNTAGSRLTTETTRHFTQSQYTQDQLTHMQLALPRLMRLTDPDELESGLKAFEQIRKTATDALIATDASFTREAQALASATDAIVAKLMTGENASALDLYVGNFNPIVEKITGLLRTRNQAKADAIHATLAERERLARRIIKITFYALGGIVVTASIVMWLFQRAISLPLEKTASRLEQTASSMRDLSAHVTHASDRVSTGATNQSQAIQETESTLSSVSTAVVNSTSHAAKASELSRITRSAAEAGATDMQAMSTAMAEMKTASDNIGRIIKTIDEIAFQTNLLALNAAVEAARAGEAGLGFAVVADEVRSLAQRSAQAARETATLIHNSISKSEHGVSISQRVQNRLQEIVARARDVDDVISEMATTTHTQSQGISSVNEAVAKLKTITTDNQSSAEESAGAAFIMESEVHVLQEAVQQLHVLVGGQLRKKLPAKNSPPAEPAPLEPQLSLHG